MKKLILITLDIYKGILSPILKSLGVNAACRFSPSCATYTKQMVDKYGVKIGIQKGIGQLRNCHPFGRIYGTNI